jgi:hypothetical protein
MKTRTIHFSIRPRKKYKHQVEVKVEDTLIKLPDVTRYLGVVIDKQLKWRNHLQHVETKMAARIGLLRYLANVAHDANPRTMINIFKWIARTVIIFDFRVLLTAID